VIVADADRSAPIEAAEKLLRAVKEFDLAKGSRPMHRAITEARPTLVREFAGILFDKVFSILLQLAFVDTPHGYKSRRPERCRIIFKRQTIERFGFDPELLHSARHQAVTTVQGPVPWRHTPLTRVSRQPANACSRVPGPGEQARGRRPEAK
jgi:hypothetical protein